MLNRRDFLQTAGAVALGSPALFAKPSATPRSCIFLFLVGGPSQLDTFDPKPDAPSEIRGPFGATRTRVPGVLLSETLPRLAGLLDRVALVRTLHHDAAPIHETGHQLIQCGRLHPREVELPHFGATLSSHLGTPWTILGGNLGNTGVDLSHGQTAGHLGASHEPEMMADSSDLAGMCRRAVALVEAGPRVVVVNQFDRVYDRLSWDCHADDSVLPTTLDDYRRTLCPNFDDAFANLIVDLDQRGLLATTLVVAAGEFGRTPRLNLRGGRDHWTGAWSAVLAGAGVEGGAVVGATDAHAAQPSDRPVTPGQFVATVYRALGISAQATIVGPDGRPMRIIQEEPIHELFRG